jgi:hypothetical protein
VSRGMNARAYLVLAFLHLFPGVASGGDLAWETSVDGYVTAMAAGQGEVFIAGRGADDQFLVGAYDAATGAVHWMHIEERTGRFNRALSLGTWGDTVFSVGSTEYDVIHDSSTFTLTAHAKGGRTRWAADVRDGKNNIGTSVVAHQGRVFSGRLSQNAGGGYGFILQVHDALTGLPAWQHDVGAAAVSFRRKGLPPSAAPLPLCAIRNVVVTGGRNGELGEGDLLAQGFDVRSGKLLWQSMYPPGDRHNSTIDLRGSADTIIAVGAASKPGERSAILLNALRPDDGRQVWQNVYESLEGDVGPLHTEVMADTVLISGYLCRPSGSCELLVLGYDLGSGVLKWQDQYDAGFFTIPTGMTIDQGQVFIVGGAQQVAGAQGVFLRSYDGRTGRIEWSEQWDVGATSLKLAASRGMIFVSGFLDQPEGRGTLLKAYRTR